MEVLSMDPHVSLVIGHFKKQGDTMVLNSLVSKSTGWSPSPPLTSQAILMLYPSRFQGW